MSLINEALKRARVEAARRDAAEKGVPPASLPVYLPPRQQPWLAPVAGFLAGLAAVTMAAGVFWFVRRPAPSESLSLAEQAKQHVRGAGAETHALSAVAKEVASDATTQASGAGDDDPPRPIRPAASAPVEVAPREAAPSVRRLPRSVAEEVPVAEELPATVATVAAPSTPPPDLEPARTSRPTDGDAGGQTFLREASPAGTKVKVDFIVWSESQPFAQINGELLSSGQSIDGYTVLNVERERVELEGGDMRFWIRIK